MRLIYALLLFDKYSENSFQIIAVCNMAIEV